MLCLIGFVATFLGACSVQPDRTALATQPIQPTASNPWELTSTNLNDNRGNHGVYLSNGNIGLTLGPFGPSKDAKVFLGGVYDTNENLLSIPMFDPVRASDPDVASYKQTLDMQRGVLTTEFKSQDGKDGRVVIFASRADRKLVVFRFEGAATPLANRLVNVPSLVGAYPSITASIQFTRNEDRSGITMVGQIKSSVMPQQSFRTTKSFANYLTEHTQAWKAAWKYKIEIDGDMEAQRVVNKALFDIRQSASPAGSRLSIPPEGLAGDFYKGHIFWDADVWILPALLPFDTDAASEIVAYRDRFTADTTAWESAASGKERAPNGFLDGRHVTADVGYGATLLLQTSIRPEQRKTAWNVLHKSAIELTTLGFRSSPDLSFGKVTGPDEMNMGIRENTYTNVMAKQILIAASHYAPLFGTRTDKRWLQLANVLKIPKTNDGLIAKCLNDDGKRTKQADGELALWPGNVTTNRELLGKSFDYHKTRPIKNGPAMTDAIHALIAAKLGRKVEAESNFREAYQPFVRGPFLLFSEKRSMDRCVFITGLGGIIQTIVYGYAGLDFSGPKPIATAHPALPDTWKGLRLTIQHRGKNYQVSITQTASTIAVIQ